MPSGVNATTGEGRARPSRRRGHRQASTGPKLGLFVEPGKGLVGHASRTIEIGIPRGAPGDAGAGLISERVLDLYPRRARSGSKFIGRRGGGGGSLGLTGAPTMAARSAARAGAGDGQAAVPGSVQPAVDLRLLEQMSRGLPDDDGFHTPRGRPEVEGMAERAGAVVLGPALGRAEGAPEFARDAARRVEIPLLVDADGLNAHAWLWLELFRERWAPPTVLTPHEAELGRLLEVGTGEMAAHRLARAREAAELSGAVVLLKGDDTIVARPAARSQSAPAAPLRSPPPWQRRRALRPDRRSPGQGPRPVRGGLHGRARPCAPRRKAAAEIHASRPRDGG